MRISDILKKRKQGISLEVYPPKTDVGREDIVQLVRELLTFNPLFVSVSYAAGGTTREGTFLMLKQLRESSDLPLMSHLTCIGEARESLDWSLSTLHVIGIDNILALRGDPPKNLAGSKLEAGEFGSARDFVEFVSRYGLFSIAVAVYPEGHRQSPGIEKEMEYMKRKIDAGADLAITQMFFDNRYYYEFRERCIRQGITIPIVPGIMPITDCRKMVRFAGLCGTTIPQAILDRLEPVQDLPEEVRKLGVEFAIKQSEDLIKNGVPYIHFYSMNRTDTMAEILTALVPALTKRAA